MLDVLECTGLWWLPEKVENKVHGKLSFDVRNGAILSLDGALNENPDTGSYYEIILGDSFGKRITLSNCVLGNFEFTLIQDARKYTKSTFVVSVLYVGCHFAKRGDIKFSKASVRFSQLEDWLGERLFQYENRDTKEGLLEHIIRMTLPKTRELTLSKLKISIWYGFSEAIGDWLRPKLEASIGISLEVDNEADVNEFSQMVHDLRNFLSLVTGNSISILELKGSKESTAGSETIDILYRKETPGKVFFSYPSFPIQYKDVSERLNVYLENWFRLIKDVEPTYDLYFGTLSNQNLFPNHEFLSLAQALESYLSRRFDNNIMPSELFEELKKKLMEAISQNASKYQKYLEPKVDYDMNRKSFRTKLKSFFETYGDMFSCFLDDKDRFVQDVVNTRNYYTHYPQELEGNPVKIEELPFLSEKLRLTLLAILLKETGIEERLIEQALQRYLQFRIRRIT
jgi:hypothetical protein